MTTFTKIPEGEKPFIEVDAAKRLSKIDPMTYGGFTEYVPSIPVPYLFSSSNVICMIGKGEDARDIVACP